MEEINKREQDPKDAVKGKIKLAHRLYDVPKLAVTLAVSEEKVLYAAKRLPKGWVRSKVFTNTTFTPSESLVFNVSRLKQKSLTLSQKDVTALHQEVLAAGGADSHLECLVIRYARHFFKKSYLR